MKQLLNLLHFLLPISIIIFMFTGNGSLVMVYFIWAILPLIKGFLELQKFFYRVFQTIIGIALPLYLLYFGAQYYGIGVPWYHTALALILFFVLYLSPLYEKFLFKKN